MTLWIVLGSILLALVLISLIRVGGFSEYSKSGLLAKLKVGPVYVTVYPMKRKPKKEKKAKKEKEKKKPPEEEPPAKPGGSLEQFKRYMPLLADAAGRAKQKIRIDRLYFDFIAAASDPALAAMEYGYANAAIGMIWPLFENNFKVKERRIRTAIDFQTTAPTVCVYAALSLTIGQAVALSLRLMVKFLKITSDIKGEQKADKTEKEAT